MIDLFWMCYTRQPAVEGFSVVRQCLPEEGEVLDQSSWMMWAFEVISNEVMRDQSEMRLENQIAQQHRTSHERIMKGK